MIQSWEARLLYRWKDIQKWRFIYARAHTISDTAAAEDVGCLCEEVLRGRGGEEEGVDYPWVSGCWSNCFVQRE